MKFYFYYLFIVTELLTIEQATATESVKQITHFQKVVKTAKERLGKKFADDQRTNNCKVPIEKRGLKPRSNQCHVSTSTK